MDFGIDNLYHYKKWEHLFSALEPGCKTPFISKAYYDSYSQVETGEVQCFWGYQDERNFLFYPYLKKSINLLGYDLPRQYWDISGAYGYNGPIGLVQNPGFLSAYNEELKEYLEESSIVTEFVRYCPITDNMRFHTYTDQISVLDNVFIDLSKGLDYVWDSSFEYRVKKTVRKGESYGLTTMLTRGSAIADTDLKVFFDIYISTMQRNEADKFYLFDFSFFSKLRDNLGDMLLISITYFEDKPISTELILLGSELAYGFLGGTLSAYYQFKANTFQRWELIKYLVDMGYQKYSMGGGASRYDSIYDFKMSFSIGCNNPFYIGTYVHNPTVYSELVSQWAKQYPTQVPLHDNKVQCYRYSDD